MTVPTQSTDTLIAMGAEEEEEGWVHPEHFARDCRRRGLRAASGKATPQRVTPSVVKKEAEDATRRLFERSSSSAAADKSS